MARRLRLGGDFRGTAVLALAETVDDPAEGDLTTGPGASQHPPGAGRENSPTRITAVARSAAPFALLDRKDGTCMRFSTHLTRVILLMAAAGGWLAWKANHAAIVFADSLRYINQARQIDAGGRSARPPARDRPPRLSPHNRGRPPDDGGNHP